MTFVGAKTVASWWIFVWDPFQVLLFHGGNQTSTVMLPPGCTIKAKVGWRKPTSKRCSWLMFTFLASRFHTVRPHYLYYNYSIVNSRTAGLKHGNVWQLSTKTSSKDSPDGDLPSLMMATQKFLCITFSALSHSPGESLHTYWWRHGRFPHIAVTCSTRSVTGGWDREPKQTVLFGLNVWFQLIVKTDSAHKAYITYVT